MGEKKGGGGARLIFFLGSTPLVRPFLPARWRLNLSSHLTGLSVSTADQNASLSLTAGTDSAQSRLTAPQVAGGNEEGVPLGSFLDKNLSLSRQKPSRTSPFQNASTTRSRQNGQTYELQSEDSVDQLSYALLASRVPGPLSSIILNMARINNPTLHRKCCIASEIPPPPSHTLLFKPPPKHSGDE
ncbi:hypothetical protein NQZ68_035294 [Dissostichus eleginoides]|nr:hypothetical protein NQZ68_035294 [Dissostichus eleginoides]